MKFLILSDIHGNLDAVGVVTQRFTDCDAILVGGDVTDFGGYDQADAVIAMLRQCCNRVFAVPGNCDPPDAERALDSAGVNLHGRAMEFNDLSIIGAGGVSKCSVDHSDGCITSPFKAVVEKAVNQTTDHSSLILVTHQPAWHTKVDRTLLGRHTGNRAIREFIEHYQPVLAVSGHIHEAAAVDTIGSTVLVNPGPCRKGHCATVTIGPDKRVEAELERF